MSNAYKKSSRLLVNPHIYEILYSRIKHCFYTVKNSSTLKDIFEPCIMSE